MRWVVILVMCALAEAQVCRLSVAGLNQNRKAMGPIHAECPPTVHSPPFGNWGVTSNFGQKLDGHQFQGWCHDTPVCDNDGNCSTQCRDGWYEWNSCTDNRQWAPPNCSLFNAVNCTQQTSVTGVNVHGSRTIDVTVRCPTDTNGDGSADQGGCADAQVYRSGTNFMSLYELDPGTTDELIQTIYFPEVVLNLNCTPWRCDPAGSEWLEPAFYDSPTSPATVYSQLAVVVNSAVFVDTSRSCQAVGPSLRAVSGASYLPLVAPESIVALFGDGLSAETRSAPSPILPTELAGTRVTITDANGATHMAPLFFVSPEQVNILAPRAVALGAAQIVVSRNDTVTSRGTVTFRDAAPGLFSADASGSGVAAATAVRIDANGQQTPVAVFTCSPGCTAVPIDLGAPGDRVYLSLYGTGIRRQPNAARPTIGGIAVEALYAGPQTQYPGLDQVNFLLPQALRGRGTVQILVDQPGARSNIVMIRVR
jgi:uncharacterized protein (TIGR03437 family)